MKKTTKILALVLAFVIAIGATAAITMALLTDSDGAVNVMTSGNVYVEQFEYQRDENGELETFEQSKPWLPVTYDPTTSTLTMNGQDYTVYNQTNVVDKIVNAENTGSTNAYIRTLIAVECPQGFDRSLLHLNLNTNGITWEEIGMITVSGTQYLLLEATYQAEIAAGQTTEPSLMQLWLDKQATNEDVELYDGPVLVLTMTQAVQATGFDSASEALDNAFGNTTTANHPWAENSADAPVVVYNADELQTALDKNVSSTIILGGDIEGNVTITQPADKDIHVLIDGANKTFDGKITIKGLSSYGNDTLTIQNINFVTETPDTDFIASSNTAAGSTERYSHNVTIENCTFTATGAAEYTCVGARFQQAYDIKLVGCTGTGLHSLLQAESCQSTITVDGATITNCKNGVSLNNTQNAVVLNTSIDSVIEGGYGVRHKGQEPGYALTVNNCQISAFVPVLVRNMTGTGYTADLTGNTLTATNNFGYQVVVSKGDWDSNTAPVAPTGSFTLTGTDSYNVFKG